MKKIYLIRHAKSSWDEPHLSDQLRPLSSRGKRACQIMAPKLDDICDFSHVFCSPARRAQETIEGILNHKLGLRFNWQTEPALYTFDSEDLFAWIKELDDNIQSFLFIGHNPALTDFCNEISDAGVSNIQTCGYIQLECAIDSWLKIKPHCGELIEFIKPKDA